jgi:hypothetical protein
MKEYASVDDPSLLGAIDSADSCRIVRQIGRGETDGQAGSLPYVFGERWEEN